MTDQLPLPPPIASTSPPVDQVDGRDDMRPRVPVVQAPADEAPLEGETTGRELAVRTIGFVPAFDGVRAVAVLLIVVIHVTGTFIPGQRELFMPGGFLGVDIFFVLSGFLITSILLREFERWGRIRMGRFYLGRVLRLVPAVAALFIVQFLWASAIGIPRSQDLPALYQAVIPTSQLGWHVLMVPNANLLAYPPGLEQFWSLVVEEQFYFVWPAILFACLAIGRNRRITLGVTGLMIAVIMFHRWSDLSQPLGWVIEYGRVDYRADSLLIGALAAQLWLAGWVPAARVIKVGAWAGLGVLGYAVLYMHSASEILYRGGFDVIAVGVAFGLLALVGTDWAPARVLVLRPLRALGTVSYGFYIWHPLAFAIILYYGNQDGWSTWSQVGLGLALAVSITVLSWYLVERPFLLLKDHMRRNRSGSETNSDGGLPSATSGAYR